MMTRGWVPPGQIHPYQSRVWRDTSRLVVIQKSRRIGISWTLLGRAVMRAIKPRGPNTYYMSHTYDSGLEAMADVEWWADRFDAKARMQGLPSIWAGGSKEKGLSRETARFASGAKIKILSAKPRKARGFVGAPDLIIDEHAFHLEADEMLKAARAALIRPVGTVTVLSTVMSADDPFYRLCEETLEEITKSEEKYSQNRTGKSFHKITFDDALHDKFMEREAWVVAQYVAEGRAEPKDLLHVQDRGLARHLERIVAEGVYGQQVYDFIPGRSLFDPEARLNYRAKVWKLVAEPDRELGCIPTAAGAQYLSKELVKRAQCEDFTVVRFEGSREFNELGIGAQEVDIRQWMSDRCHPLERLKTNPGRRWYFGVDFGRSRDLTVISLAYMDGTILKVPFMIELDNVQFSAQREFFDQTMRRLDVVVSGALDRGANGAELAEHAARSLGDHRAEPVAMNDAWYERWMPSLKKRLQDREMLMPEDEFVLGDMRQVKVIKGIPKVPRGERQKVGLALDGQRARYRHGDAAISLALVNYAERKGSANTGSYEARPLSIPPNRNVQGLG